jgi:hypothetical protein
MAALQASFRTFARGFGVGCCTGASLRLKPYLDKDSECMSTTVRLVLESFDRLEASDKREVLDEIIHRSRDLDWPPLDDETIDRIADEAFLEYDLREANSGGLHEIPNY